MRRFSVPWPALALLLTTTLVLAVAGSKMAADRQQRLFPSPVRAELRLDCGAEGPSSSLPTLDPSSEGVVLLRRECDTPMRLALFQEFPERQLLRWMEPEAGRRSLSLPLEGLDPGLYRIVTVPDAGPASPREMDDPVRDWPVRARFEVAFSDRDGVSR